jgi:phosphoribosylformylglycinamidine synthase
MDNNSEKSKFGVVVFPGSNCDYDAYYALKKLLKYDVSFLWHKETDLSQFNQNDVIILPGGFSYGDYIRPGAIAKLSPIMNSIINFANDGGIVIGICNGFQILCEAQLLPGILLKNNSRKFICKDVYIKVSNNKSIFTNQIKENEVLKIPIAHSEGNYFADEDTINSLIENEQILFQYCSCEGKISDEYNPNGSILNIAGITNKQGNVLGMMPHPERSCDSILGKTDGIKIFQSVYQSLVAETTENNYKGSFKEVSSIK